MSEALQDNKLNAIVCVAGGWAGGNAGSQGMFHIVPLTMLYGHCIDVVKNSDLMWKQSVWTSVIAAQLAAGHMAE